MTIGSAQSLAMASSGADPDASQMLDFITELNPRRRSFEMQVLRVFLSIGLKAILNGTVAGERDRPRLLEELARKLREGAEQTAGATGATTPTT
jgi:hypothetical protein